MLSRLAAPIRSERHTSCASPGLPIESFCYPYNVDLHLLGLRVLQDFDWQRMMKSPVANWHFVKWLAQRYDGEHSKLQQ